MTTIREQSDQVKAAAAGQLSADVASVFARRADQMAANGIPSDAVKVGDRLDDFSLLDDFQRHVTLDELVARNPVVLVFYRGGWCPYCNLTLRAYQQDLVPRLGDFGAKLVAVSPQTIEESATTATNAAIEFTVLSDPGSRVARSLGIAFEETQEVMTAQLSLGLDLAKVNAEGATVLPMPTALIVDTDRVVRFVDIQPDYTRRTEVVEIVDALTALYGN